VRLRGFIGEWDTVAPVRERFRAANPGYRATFDSREILYAYPLRRDDGSLVHDPRVRLLVPQDFEQWLRLDEGYIAELGVPDDLKLEQKRELFARSVSARLWWGLFGGASMLARVALNSSGPTVGQVGGVFTVPANRRQGMAMAAMCHMLKDCRDVHGHARSILFTGEADVPAQKLYESIGYQRIGTFALILG
jgi:GNAT superfamily N-acetyltransferase